MKRRRLLIGFAGVTLSGMAGCADGTSDNTPSTEPTDTALSNQTATETTATPEDESGVADIETGPAAVVDQFRIALDEGDVTQYNQLVYENVEIEQLEEGELAPADGLEYTELEIEEITPSTYESRTGETFDDQRRETQLSEVGGTEFAIVWWDEQIRINQGVPRDNEAAYLLYRIDSDWLLYEEMYIADRIAIEDIDQPTQPFENSPTGVVTQFYVSVINSDVEAANEVVYSEAPDGEISADDVEDVDNIAVAEVEQRSAEDAAEVASFLEPEDLETAALLAQDAYGITEYEFVVVSIASEEEVTQTPVLTVMDDGDWFFYTAQFDQSE